MLAAILVAQTLLSVFVAQTLLSVPDAALYRAGNHLYSIARTEGDALLFLDYDSGRLSRLRSSGGEYVGGPSIGVESPVKVRVTVGADALTIDRDGKRFKADRFEPFTTEEVPNGTLYLPRTRGRHAAIVAVPGAGNATRRAIALPAPYFARRGIAVLALDKRSDWQSATFEDLAGDVIASIETLRIRSEIDPAKIGLYASSQGGWIAPIVAARSRSVAFLVCAACPATNLTAQEIIRTEAELRADGFSATEIQNAVAYRKLYFDYLTTGAHRGELEAADQAARNARWYPRFGGIIGRDAPLATWWRINERYVPVEFWRRVRAPTLLLFGSLDTRVPPSEHAARITAAHPKATVMIVAKVDHEGFVARTGGRDEVPLLDRIPPRAIERTIDWVLALR